MEIEIKNFGPIDKMSFDLNKDLHLLYGENAVGKSYATYCLYCLIKNISNKYLDDYKQHRMIWKFNNQILNKDLKQKLEGIQLKERINCTKAIITQIEKYLSKLIVTGLQKSFYSTFTSLAKIKNRFTQQNYEIIIRTSESEHIHLISDDNGALDLVYHYSNWEKIELTITDSNTRIYSLLINGENELIADEKDFFDLVDDFVLQKVNQVLRKLNTNIRDVYYLPAGRAGLYQALNAFSPILAKLTQNRYFIQSKQQIELPTLSEPLADYFIDLSTLDKTNLNDEFKEVIDFMQGDILDGEVRYDEVSKQILYQPNAIDLVLNLSNTSSMTAELSPLVLYLRHIIHNKYGKEKYDIDITPQNHLQEKRENYQQYYDILFIEEPEAHLHPINQVKLINVFMKLINLNLKIVITSHSNYMFNKINNLIIKKEVEADRIGVYHMVQSDQGAIVDQSMNSTDEGINDENFQAVSEELYLERLKYYEDNDR